MTVRAKFVVNTVTTSLYSGWDNQLKVSRTRKVYTVKLYPVASSEGEDEAFWSSTPSGSIELGIVNPAAAEQFMDRLGQKVYVDFTPADD